MNTISSGFFEKSWKRKVEYSEKEILGQKNLPPMLVNFKQALTKHQKNKYGTELDTPEKRDNIVKLFLKIQEKEQENSNKYQMLHAQDSFFFAYQVIAKTLYELKNHEHHSKFKFLRYPDNMLTKTTTEFFKKYPDLVLTDEQYDAKMQEVKKSEENEKLGFDLEEEHDDQWQINDTLPEISEQLLSVNFTLETYVSLDSALFVFLTGRGVSQRCSSKDDADYLQKLKNILEKIFSKRKYQFCKL